MLSYTVNSSPLRGVSTTVLKSDRRQGCLPRPEGIFGGGVAPVLKLDRRQGSVTNAKTSVRVGGGVVCCNFQNNFENL